jgi:hypothetical protein
MSDSGPTVVGSIVAQLKIDASDFNKKLDEAELAVKRLSRTDPTVKVKSDVADAVAKLDAVKRATDDVATANTRLSVAERQAQNTASTAYIANLRLEDVLGKRGRTELQVAAATEAASRADRNAEAAELRHLAATTALTEAQKAFAAANAIEAVSQDDANDKESKSNELHRTSISRVGAIVAAVAALLPLLAPVGAYALAAAGGLAGMGAAGILAIVGIKNAMASGTDVGNAYSAGLALLKSDLNQLSSTAAVSMLVYFKSAVSEINAALPELNDQVGVFSRILGGTGNAALQGTLNVLHTLNPLFVTAAQYVERLAVGFLSWTQTGGLAKFSSYAMAALPQVAGLLGTLASSAVRVVQALAPAGTAMIGFLTILANVISFVSGAGPVFAAGVAGVTAFAVAFKLFGAVTPLITAATEAIYGLAAAEKLALGPIGLVVAGITALIAVLSVSAASATQAKGAVDDYTAAVQADNGVIGENVRLQAAKALSDAGAFAAAQRLGIASKVLTDASLGNADATRVLNEKLAANKAQAVAAAGAIDGYSAASYKARSAIIRNANEQNEAIRASADTQKDAIATQIKAYNDIQKALGGTTISTRAQLAAEQDLAKSAGVSLGTYLQASAAQRDTKTQMDLTTATMYLQNDAAGLLKQTLDKLNGKTLDAAGAQNQFDSQLANMSTHIDETGKTINRANTILDGMTAAAVANRGELISLTHAALDNADAFRANGGSATDTIQKLKDMRQSIIDNAVAHGEDKKSVQDYLDTLFKIPSSLPPTKLEVDNGDALDKINAVLYALSQVPASARTSVGVDISKVPSSNPWVPKPKGSATGEPFVSGPGTPTSDSIPRWLSVGEAVIKTSRASEYRPMLYAINNGTPNQIRAAAANISGGNSTTTHNHFPTTVIVQADPTAAYHDFSRRQSMGW